MHCFVVLFAFGVASVLTIEKECSKLAKLNALDCCKWKMPMSRWVHNVAVKECHEELGKPAEYDELDPDTNCEIEECIAKKRGYITDNTTINKTAIEIEYYDRFVYRPELLLIITKMCFDGDVTEYGPEDLCELKKFEICARVQHTTWCPKFDDKEDCKEIKDLAEKCADKNFVFSLLHDALQNI